MYTQESVFFSIQLALPHEQWDIQNGMFDNKSKPWRPLNIFKCFRVIWPFAVPSFTLARIYIERDGGRSFWRSAFLNPKDV